MRAKKKLKNIKNSEVESGLIRSMTKKPDDFDEKYMKIKFNLDDKLPLNKTVEIRSMVIVVRAVFLSTGFFR